LGEKKEKVSQNDTNLQDHWGVGKETDPSRKNY